MSTSNLDTQSLADLSSFEPEAILAAVPGEHPRAAAALALGREASETGSFDVAELSRIANELYAEGFPAGSPLASGGSEPAIPSTASLSHQVSDAAIPANVAPAATPSSKASLADANVPATQANTSFNDYLPSKEIELNQLLGGLNIPYESELHQLLDVGGADKSTPSFGQLTQPSTFGGISSADRQCLKVLMGSIF